jgi:thiaminase
MEMGCQCHALAVLTPGNDPVPTVQKAGWALEPVWMGAENLAPKEFWSCTIQPTARHYTNYAIMAQLTMSLTINMVKSLYLLWIVNQITKLLFHNTNEVNNWISKYHSANCQTYAAWDML